VGAGVLASENPMFVPLIAPFGVSASTKTAVELAALNELTVALNPLIVFVKFDTLVDRPPTVLLTEVRELEFPETVVAKLLRFEVKVVMAVPCPPTVEFKVPKELDKAVRFEPCVVTEEPSDPTVVFRFDIEAASLVAMVFKPATVLLKFVRLVP
jgi:hypothetical protein